MVGSLNYWDWGYEWSLRFYAGVMISLLQLNLFGLLLKIYYLFDNSFLPCALLVNYTLRHREKESLLQ